MEQISNRHESDLGGRLLPFGNGGLIDVTVHVLAETAHFASVQHTAWMLVNLLCRFEGVVRRVGFNCPAGVPLVERVVPFVANATEFRNAVLAGGNEIGVVPVEGDTTSSYTLTVGPGGKNGVGTFYVYGEGWSGSISADPIPARTASTLPFGPYVAACIAAGEVFKAARMSAEAYEPVTNASYSAWHHQATEGSATAWLGDGPTEFNGIELDVALAGVGAVGSAWMHTLWACPGLSGTVVIADNDVKGLESTNLNRYCLFGRSSIGKLKASEAARIAVNTNIRWQADDKAFEDKPRTSPLVISAVDRNRARAAIQTKYPARILSGSTLDLRAEILRCGPPGIGACLRCYNPPEEVASDEQLREHLLDLPAQELSRLTAAAQVSVEDGRAWASTGQCGIAGARLLPYLRQGDFAESEAPPQFAVSFVSVMAGTLLAAETIKETIGADGPLSGTLSRAVFQFWFPTARTNRAASYLRDQQCPMCSPGTPATSIWRQRFEGMSPGRH